LLRPQGEIPLAVRIQSRLDRLPPRRQSSSGGVAIYRKGDANAAAPTASNGSHTGFRSMPHGARTIHGGENGPEPHHHVIAVVKAAGIWVRPFRLRENWTSPLTFRPPTAVSKEVRSWGTSRGMSSFLFRSSAVRGWPAATLRAIHSKSPPSPPARLLDCTQQRSLTCRRWEKSCKIAANRSNQYATARKKCAVSISSRRQQIKSPAPAMTEADGLTRPPSIVCAYCHSAHCGSAGGSQKLESSRPR